MPLDPVRRFVARRRDLYAQHQRIARVQMEAAYLVEELQRRRDGLAPCYIDLDCLRRAVEEVDPSGARAEGESDV